MTLVPTEIKLFAQNDSCVWRGCRARQSRDGLGAPLNQAGEP
jgi:hypothetical protein